MGIRAIFSIPIARSNQSQSGLTKLSDNLNLADDVFVERVQVLRWNPVFRMERAPDLLNAKSTQVVRPRRKLRDEPCAACLYIPISRDLNGVVFVRDRMENRLIGQARWELTPS
jgi:hypothetical protein